MLTKDEIIRHITKDEFIGNSLVAGGALHHKHKEYYTRIGIQRGERIYPKAEILCFDEECSFSFEYLPKEGRNEGTQYIYDTGEGCFWDYGTHRLLFKFLEATERMENGGLEFSFLLNKKPKKTTLEFEYATKNISLTKQKKLTEEEKKKGFTREKHIEETWACYHATKKNNRYKTGKIFHLWRPVAIDATGKSCMGKILFTKNRMRIVFPNKFLEKATYPVYIDPTFGYTTAGASGFTLGNAVGGMPVSLGEVADITNFYAYIFSGTTSTSNRIAFGIYNNSASLVGQESTDSFRQTAGWDEVIMETPTVLTPASYYIATTLKSTLFKLGYDDAPEANGNTLYAYSRTWDGEMPSTILLTTAYADKAISLYALYDSLTTVAPSTANIEAILHSPTLEIGETTASAGIVTTTMTAHSVTATVIPNPDILTYPAHLSISALLYPIEVDSGEVIWTPTPKPENVFSSSEYSEGGSGFVPVF